MQHLHKIMITLKLEGPNGKISSCYQQDTAPKSALRGKSRHGELACKFTGNKEQDTKSGGLWRGFWSSLAWTLPGS